MTISPEHDFDPKQADGQINRIDNNLIDGMLLGLGRSFPKEWEGLSEQALINKIVQQVPGFIKEGTKDIHEEVRSSDTAIEQIRDKE